MGCHCRSKRSSTLDSRLGGAWVDGACYIEGSPETKRARNLAKNPNVVVHLENGTEVVIIEGEAEAVIKPDRDFAVRMAKAMGDKYGDNGYRPEPNSWDEGGLHRIKPRLILAWSRFPADTTRWVFE